GAGGLGLRGTGRGGGGPAPPDPSRDATPGGARGGRPLVAGALSRQEIQGVIRRHLDAIRFCYEQRLAQDPDLAGRVTVRFEISPEGRVRTARVSASTLNDAAVERCVVRQVRRWRFPPPRGGGLVRVNYPFVFRSGGSDEDASDASGEAADDEASAADE
ncbi:MAG TPA: AgmX/PglI C-terminal domain-containing protein, partial [Sandaracinaceae bacterium LLY-WYZ-13_1]|nr:AgmX/PglI C-terminal domain-containing protein [Sandaracinaceae bacterium LLY-WYZ-13_1]